MKISENCMKSKLKIIWIMNDFFFLIPSSLIILVYILELIIFIVCVCPPDFQTFRRPCFTYNRILDCFSPRLLSLCKQIVFQLSIERRESKGLTRIFKLSKSILSLSKKHKTMQYYLKMSSCQSSTCFI